MFTCPFRNYTRCPFEITSKHLWGSHLYAVDGTLILFCHREEVGLNTQEKIRI